MAIRPIPKEVIRSFPAARLYLDDIEEIYRIFVETDENRSEKLPTDSNQKLKTMLLVEDQICDTLGDLRTIHPHFTHKFFMEVSKPGFNLQIVFSKIDTSWNSYGLTENEEWGMFHKLENIFEARKVPWKQLLHSRSGLTYAIYGAITTLFMLLVPTTVTLWRLSSRIRPKFSWLPGISTMVLGCVAVMVIALWLGLRSHGVVIFRSRSDHSSQKREAAWAIVPDIIKIIGGFLLGILTLYIKHKYWP